MVGNERNYTRFRIYSRPSAHTALILKFPAQILLDEPRNQPIRSQPIILPASPLFNVSVVLVFVLTYITTILVRVAIWFFAAVETRIPGFLWVGHSNIIPRLNWLYGLRLEGC